MNTQNETYTVQTLIPVVKQEQNVQEQLCQAIMQTWKMVCKKKKKFPTHQQSLWLLDLVVYNIVEQVACVEIWQYIAHGIKWLFTLNPIEM